MYFPHNLFDENTVVIANWKKYSQQSHGENAIKQQFDNLLNFADTFMSDVKQFNQCAHNNFENQASFLDILWGYINANTDCIQIVKRHEKITTHPSYPYDIHPIKCGICMDCIQKFIIKTNGLNHIFTNWQNNTLNDLKWRSEFNNTNIILTKQPIFLKCILSASNIQCLSKIFNLFFVSFLQNVNLNSLVIKNKLNENYLKCPAGPSVNIVCISNTNINIMHGIEHSLSSLSTIINELIPLLKLHHIKYLFIDNKALKNIAFIIDKFIEQYVEMPHLALPHDHSSKQYFDKFKGIKKYEKWRKRMLNDKLFAKNWPYKDKEGKAIFCLGKQRISIDDTFDMYIYNKHPILQRFIAIFAMLYKKFQYYHKKLRKQNFDKDKELIRQLRIQRDIFRYLMYRKQQEYAYQIITMNDHLWSLVAAILPYIESNKSKAMIHRSNIYCTVCHKQQNKDITFKVCCNCQITYYCRKKCQKYDWNRNQHKLICKQLVASMACTK